MRASSEGAAPVRAADGPSPELNEVIDRVGLVDHHAHSVVSGTVDRDAYAFMLDESDRPASARAAGLDTQVAFAVRRWCAPLLGLAPDASLDEFLRARLALSARDAVARFLPSARLDRLLVETGYRGDELMATPQLERLAETPLSTVARLETIAESVATEAPAARDFADAVRRSIEAALAAGAVGLKSIVAYRAGLDVDPRRPSDAEVERAAAAWLATLGPGSRPRLVDPVLLRFLLWAAVDTGRPLQVHTGFGDPDLHLRRSDPLLLTDFIRLAEGRGPILLLHTYPFHREAGYLAQMFEHVYVDVGLAVNYTGAQSPHVIAESLELAPFRRILFSSDAWGLPELHLIGSLLFRRGLSRVLGQWVVDGDWPLADAERVVRMIAAENARRVYGLSDEPDEGRGAVEPDRPAPDES